MRQREWHPAVCPGASVASRRQAARYTGPDDRHDTLDRCERAAGITRVTSTRSRTSMSCVSSAAQTYGKGHLAPPLVVRSEPSLTSRSRCQIWRFYALQSVRSANRLCINCLTMNYRTKKRARLYPEHGRARAAIPPGYAVFPLRGDPCAPRSTLRARE